MDRLNERSRPRDGEGVYSEEETQSKGVRRTSEGGPSPTEVKPSTLRVYVMSAVRPEMVVSWLSSVLCFCQALSGASGSEL
ncbi:hypothetical protein EYF80_012292 [Liparis tanakae]|uniref:Uncharacterized protein n=1 Tax=Liparis tanakae TaxID=230148 RepID=A0A4Z2II00_9TELE|nr:hypothetical protein EYF80_012292 [Liparis tanakae]